MIKHLKVALAAALITLGICGLVTGTSNARFFVFAVLLVALNILDIVECGDGEDVEELWMKRGFGVVLMCMGLLFLLSTVISGGTLANVTFLALLAALTFFLKSFPPWSSNYLRQTKTSVGPPQHARPPQTRDSGVKSFLLLFCKKEGLASSPDCTIP